MAIVKKRYGKLHVPESCGMYRVHVENLGRSELREIDAIRKSESSSDIKKGRVERHGHRRATCFRLPSLETQICVSTSSKVIRIFVTYISYRIPLFALVLIR